jgi:hypothetical protein
VTDLAQLVEPGPPILEDEGSIPGGDITSFSSISVPPDTDEPGEPSIPITMDQVDGESETVDMDTSSGSIQPGQRPPDSQEASHVSETQESLGIPLGTPPTPIVDQTLRAMEAIRNKKITSKKTQASKPNFKF